MCEGSHRRWGPSPPGSFSSQEAPKEYLWAMEKVVGGPTSACQAPGHMTSAVRYPSHCTLLCAQVNRARHSREHSQLACLSFPTPSCSTCSYAACGLCPILGTSVSGEIPSNTPVSGHESSAWEGQVVFPRVAEPYSWLPLLQPPLRVTGQFLGTCTSPGHSSIPSSPSGILNSPEHFINTLTSP